jgi:hypothetical protein
MRVLTFERSGSRWGLTAHLRLLVILAALSSLGLSAASSADSTSKDTWKGSWKFELDRQDQPALSYYDSRGRRIFGIACGAHFEMNAVYPGAAPKEDTTGSITIASGKTQMDFAGNVFHNPEVEMPTDLPFFNQASLGHPELDGDKWRALENSVFDFLDSGQPLTISAEGKSYVLPAVKAPRWRARFQKIC